MSERIEFVELARREEAGLARLCARFGISRKTGYKWLKRYEASGAEGLRDASRRPRSCPWKTPDAVEQAVLAVRRAHPAWGGRKIRRVLQNHGQPQVPSASTITAILQRHGLIEEEASRDRRAFTRFEHPYPNALWQMDFKGPLKVGVQRCHPLTVLDDHSRYNIGLRACGDQRALTVRAQLTGMFQRHGLPDRMLMDNGAPWGHATASPWTGLTVWLIDLGVGVTHGRPYHPQTQGKDERFHRTLAAELLSRRCCSSLRAWQRAFDGWRETYNHVRPHEALAMETPVDRYRVSDRAYPETLPPVEYDSGDQVRKVQMGGEFHFRGLVYHVSKAFYGRRIALRATHRDGGWDLYYRAQRIGWVDEKTKECGHGRHPAAVEADDDRARSCARPPFATLTPARHKNVVPAQETC